MFQEIITFVLLNLYEYQPRLAEELLKYWRALEECRNIYRNINENLKQLENFPQP